MHCGHERAGFWGLIVAGLSFIVPAIVLTGALAFAYVEYGSIPEIAPFFMGIKPVVLSIIVMAVYKLGKKALKSTALGILGALVLLLSFLGIHEIYLLLGAGVIGAMVFHQLDDFKKDNLKNAFPFLLMKSTVATGAVAGLSSLKIFWIFLKVGSVLYGSGYVLFAYLDAELVDAGFLSQQELLDAIAMGQFTPGPVLSTATFIGYQMNGFWGAISASAGIFLPSFVFVFLLNPWVPKMRQSKFLRHFLDAVNIAAVAVMLAVVVEMGYQSVVDWKTAILCVLSFVVVFTYQKINPAWIILGGSLLGYALYWI